MTLREPMSDECIEWDGALNADFYGTVWVRENGVRKKWLVHRLVWEEERGPIPPGLFVLHQCDNQPCINIGHMFLGTAKDNALDMVAKGRHRDQKKTHCKRGHELSGSNLSPYKLRITGLRNCHICMLILRKRYRDKKRAERTGAV